MNPITNILYKATKTDSIIRVLTCPTHERYESGLCQVPNVEFYAVRTENVKDWNSNYAKKPDNYILLEKNKIPPYLKVDCVLSQNKFGQFQLLSPIARQLSVPLISLEHTLPMPEWSEEQLNYMNSLRGDINLFISRYSIGQWKWQDHNDTGVIHHMVDTEKFKPLDIIEKEKVVFSCVNDWVNRDWCCGFKLWQEIQNGLPTKVRGDTPGLSTATESVDELIYEYRSSKVFLNTSLISPIPTVVLEAMSCGLPVVSTNNCMLPEIIEHGVNGFLSNDPKELHNYCKMLLEDDELCERMGAEARNTILTHFSPTKFIDTWTQIFTGAADES